MQRYVSFLLIILFILPTAAQPRKKVGLVLSGGGAKGVAHVGALKVIEEAGIPIDYIAGTSMGAIVGGLYAIGYTSHQLDSMIKNQDWAYLISDATRRNIKTFAEKEEDATYVVNLPFIRTPREVIPDGIIKGKNIEALFTALTIGYHDSIDFNRLPIPYACVAVDLVEGREVVFHDGKLPQVMRASMAIPAAFTPVRMDSMVLVDGGLINNFPVDVARAMGAEIIIGVDVQNEPKEEPVITVTDIVGQMASMLSRGKYAENLKNVDLHIKVDVEGFTAASFNQEALDTLTIRGEHAAQGEWDRLIALKQAIGIPPGYMPEPHGPYHFLSDDNPVFIRSISFSGIEGADARRLMRRCNIQQNSILTMNQLRGAVDELYATQIFTNVSYLLTKADDGYDLTFSFDDIRTNQFRFGLRFDWEEVASVLLNANYHFRSKIPTTGAVTARFGKRSGVRLDYTVYPNPLRFFNAAYSFEYNDINIYRKGRREYNATYDRHMGEIGYSNIFNQDLKLGVGLRYEYFNYKDFLYNSSQQEINVASEGFFSYYALLHYETMDMKTYPTRGTSLRADAALYTDNLVSYNGHSPFAALSLWWKTVYSVSDRVAIIPSTYGRVLLGQDAPYPYFNAVGGSVPGRYVPQQIPFEGINYMEIVENSLFVANLRLRHKFGRNHYVYLTLNYGLTAGDLSNIFDGRQLFGGGLTYGYDSLFGPIEASLNLSNSTRKLGFYLNIGYTF